MQDSYKHNTIRVYQKTTRYWFARFRIHDRAKFILIQFFLGAMEIYWL